MLATGVNIKIAFLVILVTFCNMYAYWLDICVNVLLGTDSGTHSVSTSTELLYLLKRL